jgi:peptidoglycan hydrolase CwlO-like protein
MAFLNSTLGIAIASALATGIVTILSTIILLKYKDRKKKGEMNSFVEASIRNYTNDQEKFRQALMDSNTELKEEVESLKKDLNEVSEKYNQLEKELKETREERAKLQTRVKQLETDIKKKNEEVKKLQSIINNMSRKNLRADRK